MVYEVCSAIPPGNRILGRLVMTKKRRRGAGPCLGFTLLDLVVTIGLLALVVPLALPVLRDAGEQARIDQCLSNLHRTMRAANMYIADYDGSFPLQLNPSAVCSWGYGGQTTDDYWVGEPFYIPVTQRPLNPYLLGARVQPDLMNGNQVVHRTPIPMLQCPSDRSSHQRSFGWSGDGASPISCYNDVGTSYQFNLHALFDVSWWGDSDPWTPPGDWNDLTRVLIHDVLTRQAATFTLLIEDPMDWGLASSNRIVTVGNHAEFGKHSCGYLDGHGDYLYRDTRGWCGVGWEAINRAWILSADYTPPIHYVPYGPVYTKNCDPPSGRAQEGGQ
jgi:type II secretory pathway pseudopilin PulG